MSLPATVQTRELFPVLKQKIYNKPLVYLDSAASALKPVMVLETEKRLVEEYYGNIHRASHFMADKATVEFEAVRDKVKTFIHAPSREEIIFTGGTTESINLVAFSFSERYIEEGDEIIVSEMEHHSNLVPWQMAAQRKKAVIKILPFDNNGDISLAELENLISSRTRLIAVTHVSNVLGTINPVSEITALAHRYGIAVLVDGAQAVQHFPVDVQALDVDFYAFSAHKAYGPNGVGVLFGKRELLDSMPPWQGGGEMIAEVSFAGTTYNELPYKFEAGTPNISGVIGFGAAIDFLNSTGPENMEAHDKRLIQYATDQLRQVDGLTILGNCHRKSGVVTFNLEGIHHYDLGMLLDKQGIAVRTGRLCADPVMDHFRIPGAVRISFGVYTTIDEIDVFIEALRKSKMMLE